ncbi:MAG TPA: riboflavin synthase [Vicinamibacterales bacterium]|nr:riboflavin synthase [Vicinamibacterales bacterium]
MFTGLVESVGHVVQSAPTGAGVRMRIATGLAPALALGDSLAVNGVCLTVVAQDDTSVCADIGPETLRVTTLGTFKPGDVLNLERSMRADSRFGGHFVQGHIDAVGRIEAVTPEAEFHTIDVSYPDRFAANIVHRGSIAVDGISLTVAALSGNRFQLMIIPFTMAHTNLGHAAAGTPVNLEFDMVGKYVARAAEVAAATAHAHDRRAGQAIDL